jgi:XTP/dITP diphosphohydrolase
MTERRLVLASNNPGKLAELLPLFAPLGFTLVTQGALGIPEAAEPHHTFIENALAKARHASAASGLPAVADDAGLCVDAFNGQPGVDTAHYATRFGLPKGDANNVKVLLAQLAALEAAGGAAANRAAALVSTLVAVRHPQDPEPLVAVGRAVGQITREPIGDQGFGFDPVMYIPALGCTFAQLPPEVKNLHSHRGKASREMVRLMQERWA